MFIYLFIGFFFGILALLEPLYKVNDTVFRKILHGYLFLLVSLFVIVIVGFREIGFDYESYSFIFKMLSSSYWSENANVVMVEKGYAFLNYWLVSFRLLFVVMALMTVGLQFSFIYKYSPLPFFSLFLYLGIFFYASLMGQYRQALALGFILWAFVFKDRKFLFLILMIGAITFHVSSMLAFIVLLVSKQVYQLRWYIIGILLALFSNLALKPLLVDFSNFMPDFVKDKLNHYLLVEEGLSLGLNLSMLLKSVTFILFYYYRDKLSEYKFGEYFLNIYYISLLVYLGLGFLPQLSGRGSIYFYFVEIILAAMIVVKEVGIRRVLVMAFFMLVCVYRQINFFTLWGHDYIPYKNSLLNILGF